MLLKKISIKALVIFIVALFFQNGWAKNGFGTIKGEEIKQLCIVALQILEQKNVPENLVAAASDSTKCTTYIVAVNDAVFMQAGVASGVIENRDAKIHMPYCLPDDVKMEEYIKVILQYIKENPDTLEVHAAIVVYGALVKNYPCNE